MNIEQRIERAHSKLPQYTKKQLEEISNVLTDTDKEALLNGEPVKIMGYGSLISVKRKQRKGTKPGTRNPIIIKEHMTIRFVPSSAFKDELNKV